MPFPFANPRAAPVIREFIPTAFNADLPKLSRLAIPFNPFFTSFELEGTVAVYIPKFLPKKLFDLSANPACTNASLYPFAFKDGMFNKS